MYEQTSKEQYRIAKNHRTIANLLRGICFELYSGKVFLMDQLTRMQFNVLEKFVSAHQYFTPQQLEDKSGIFSETTGTAIKELSGLGYINDSGITPLGIRALEPYKVRRAVFLQPDSVPAWFLLL